MIFNIVCWAIMGAVLSAMGAPAWAIVMAAIFVTVMVGVND